MLSPVGLCGRRARAREIGPANAGSGLPAQPLSCRPVRRSPRTAEPLLLETSDLSAQLQEGY